MSKTLIVILGPTGVGKTDLSIRIAKHFNTVISSSDSRQVYREMSIGTAVPEKEQLEAVKHHFIHTHSIHDYFSSWECEKQTIELLTELYKEKDEVLLVGGSMMYIDAVCNGIDEIPTIDPELRQEVFTRYEKDGLESMKMQLKQLDPVFYDQVDLKNAKRVIHAVEICLMTGKPYSELRTNSKKKRDFKIVKIGLNRDRTELYSRINTRVDQMIEEGLIEEAKAIFEFRHYNSLNTVGYKELFEHFDGNISLEKAIELIKRNSRRYAKRQLSWFRRDEEIEWFHPDQEKEVLQYIEDKIKKEA
ncbi:tRNA (adenosine(37)-N6)-dimethylallyltransferase MiaA [Labilibaculum sp. DW002]|uniref:tRNA dimethylallyltransferase n=1 Tax=Paralabilibaculum antarcticum TaxID=2912572 RepID=A0ABT5VU53_9BACT|nr:MULTISPECIES: tRNA (adenosine(37)-N6)-dimethylallyltransferase MiaA [unclassified Labilibaculum]MBI9057911.1 tRNA (adenosine(37)-N6)-dimethylallyltransferase MiaA [Labilibaculum sp.]MDE5418862.1 tRNA (adenosine(37)-N6)-dimethylallyltransferase MiaA [Labilibaculum sp. DW002]